MEQSADSHSPSTPSNSRHPSIRTAQTPSSAPRSTQRWKVRWRCCHPPNSLGKRFHWQELRIRKMTPSSILRLLICDCSIRECRQNDDLVVIGRWVLSVRYGDVAQLYRPSDVPDKSGKVYASFSLIAYPDTKDSNGRRIDQLMPNRTITQPSVSGLLTAGSRADFPPGLPNLLPEGVPSSLPNLILINANAPAMAAM